jgi:hypothetical protein
MILTRVKMYLQTFTQSTWFKLTRNHRCLTHLNNLIVIGINTVTLIKIKWKRKLREGQVSFLRKFSPNERQREN